MDLAGPEKADAAVSVDPLGIVDLSQLLTAPLSRADAAAVGHAADDTKHGAVNADIASRCEFSKHLRDILRDQG